MTSEQTSTTRRRRLLGALAFCAILFALLAYASAVLKPGRGGEQAGAAWGAFRSQPKNSIDAIFFGSSHVFDGVDPATLWRERGIAGFVNGGPTQPIPIMKYYVRESFKTQQPKVIVLEMSTASYSPDRFDRNFHLINVGYMPWGLNKLGAILFETPAGERTAVAVDLWTYHSRWNEVSAGDFNPWRKNLGTPYLKGFLPKIGAKEVTPTPTALTPEARKRADLNLDAYLPDLEAMVSEAEKRDVQVLLLLTPTAPPGIYSYQAEEALRRLSAKHDNVKLLDLNKPGAVPGLDYETDFFDGGHVTYEGAEKTSAAIAEYLALTYGLPDRSGDPAYASYDRDATERDRYVEAQKVRRARMKRK